MCSRVGNYFQVIGDKMSLEIFNFYKRTGFLVLDKLIFCQSDDFETQQISVRVIQQNKLNNVVFAQIVVS